MLKRSFFGLALITGLCVPGMGSAATTWVWTTNAVANKCGEPADWASTTLGMTSLLASGNTCAGTGSAATVATVNGISNTNNGLGSTNTGATNATGTANTLETAYSVTAYAGGLGIQNRDACSLNATVYTNCDASENVSPEHAVDNNQRNDMVLLTFTTQVALSSINLGWISNDSDLTIMAYNETKGAAATAPSTVGSSLFGKTWNQVTGWTVIGNPQNVVASTNTAVNAGQVFSSAWLIGAYNSQVSGQGAGDGILDYVKLYSVTACAYTDTTCNPPTQTPEPGSLALMATSLLGFMAIRRRKSRD